MLRQHLLQVLCEMLQVADFDIQVPQEFLPAAGSCESSASETLHTSLITPSLLLLVCGVDEDLGAVLRCRGLRD